MTDTTDTKTEEPRLPAPSRIRPIAIGVALLVCGVIIGSGATMLMVRAEAARAMGDPSWMSKRAAERMERDLDLSPEQSEQVQDIFMSHRERVQAFRAQHGERASQLFGELQAEIESVLNPDQAEKFRDRLERARQRAFRHHDGRRGDGDRDRDGQRRRPPSSEWQPNQGLGEEAEAEDSVPDVTTIPD